MIQWGCEKGMEPFRVVKKVRIGQIQIRSVCSTGSVAQNVFQCQISPSGVRPVGQVCTKVISYAIVRFAKTAVAKNAESDGGNRLCNRIAVVRRVSGMVGMCTDIRLSVFAVCAVCDLHGHIIAVRHFLTIDFCIQGGKIVFHCGFLRVFHVFLNSLRTESVHGTPSSASALANAPNTGGISVVNRVTGADVCFWISSCQ